MELAVGKPRSCTGHCRRYFIGGRLPISAAVHDLGVVRIGNVREMNVPCPPGLIPNVAGQASVVVGSVYLVQVKPPSWELKSPTRSVPLGWPLFSMPTKTLPEVPTAILTFWVVPSMNRAFIAALLTCVQVAPQSFDL